MFSSGNFLEKSVILYVSYGLKQGNPFAKVWYWLIICHFSCLLLCDFYHLVKQVIKGKNFINDKEKIRRTLRQILTETGEFLEKNPKSIIKILCCYFVIILESPTMTDLPFNSIKLESYIRTQEENHSKLSGNTG